MICDICRVGDDPHEMWAWETVVIPHPDDPLHSCGLASAGCVTSSSLLPWVRLPNGEIVVPASTGVTS